MDEKALDQKVQEILSDASSVHLKQTCREVSHDLLEMTKEYIESQGEEQSLIALSMYQLYTVLIQLDFLLSRQEALTSVEEKSLLVNIYASLARMQVELFEICCTMPGVDRRLKEVVVRLSSVSLFFTKYLL